MEDSKENLIEIIRILCDTVSDTPCGCEVCPYNSDSDECEVEELINRN